MKIRYPLNRFHPAVFTIVSTLMFGSTGSTTQLSSLGAVDRDPTVGQVVRCGTNTACPKQSYDQHLPELRSRGRTEQSETRLESNVQPPPSRHLIGIADEPCPVAEATLGGLRHSLAVTLPEGSTTRVESLLTVAWTIKEPQPRGPAYLILATEHVARFRGDDFYVLAPGAAAPFRLEQFAEQTRVVIPLHVPGAPQTGEIKIRPLAAGRLRMSIASCWPDTMRREF